MKNKINKFIHSKYLLISLIVLLILLVMATGTYAWFTWRSTSNTSLTMNIGKLADVTFNSGNDISTSTLAPVYNYTDGEKTTFRINNKDTTGASLDYNIKLNITSIASELKSSDLKYVLLKDNTIVKEGNFSTMVVGTNTIYSNSISSSGTTNFIFYLYIDGNSENNLNMMNKSLVGTITVEGNEVIGETLSSYIENLMADGEYETVTNNGVDYDYNTVNSLMDDNYGNIRYYGSSPNNYVYFNCDDYSNQSSSTCEVWRIIGLFNDQNEPSLIKIVRNDSIGNFPWDPYNNFNGWNDAGMRFILNNYSMEGVQGGGLYWNRRSGTCLNGDSGTCDFTTTGLKNDATRNAIYNAKWQVSAISETLFYSNEAYENEMGLGTEVEDYIGLISTSDYGFAADFRTCSSQIFDYDICSEVNWLLNGEDQWTIIPMDNENTYSVYNSGMLSTLNVSNVAAIRPTLYLNFNVIKKDGTGTSSDPYQLRVS